MIQPVDGSSPRLASVILVSIVFAFLRIYGYTSEAFQAMAHLWVGGLIALYMVRRQRGVLFVIVALSIVETICFIATHRG
jgi:hypothetical protein